MRKQIDKRTSGAVFDLVRCVVLGESSPSTTHESHPQGRSLNGTLKRTDLILKPVIVKNYRPQNWHTNNSA